MEASAVAPEASERANELYWSSGRSVNQIAEELDLSKGALYALIEPLVTGTACPACGSEVVYSNRTAQERGQVDCLTCDWEGSVVDTAPADGENDLIVRAAPTSGDDYDNRVRTIVGGALLGAAAGLALVMWARRR